MSGYVQIKVVPYGSRVALLPSQLQSGAMAIFAEHGGRALDIADQIVPRHYHRLAETLRFGQVSEFQFALEAGGLVVTGITDKPMMVDYAGYVERDQPYLRPAYEAVYPDVLADLKQIGAYIPKSSPSVRAIL